MNGYYSLIQYCPDRARAEAANVGVVVTVPGRHILEVRLSSGNHRVRRFFREAGSSLEALRAFKETFRQRVKAEQFNFESIEDVNRFVATRGNDFRLTPPRELYVENAAETAELLLASLVGGSSMKISSERRTSMQSIKKRFENPDVSALIRRDVSIELPVVSRTLVAPFAFQNGSLNLIKPHAFSADLSRTFRDASTLAIEGDLLRKHDSPSGHARLIILPIFEVEGGEARKTAEALFTDFKVRFTPFDRLEDLIEEVKRTAHA